MERKKTPALKTVEKALGVLDILGEAQKPMTASEAAKAAGMPHLSLEAERGAVPALLLARPGVSPRAESCPAL